MILHFHNLNEKRLFLFFKFYFTPRAEAEMIIKYKGRF